MRDFFLSAKFLIYYCTK